MFRHHSFAPYSCLSYKTQVGVRFTPVSLPMNVIRGVPAQRSIIVPYKL